MRADLERLKAELSGLSMAERAELALFLIQSLEPESEEGTEAAWDAELARRVGEIERGEVTGIPAEEVFNRLRAK